MIRSSLPLLSSPPSQVLPSHVVEGLYYLLLKIRLLKSNESKEMENKLTQKYSMLLNTVH
jgi:hypothetical protein